MVEYHEMVISGSFLYIKGLITGLCFGANLKPDLIFNREHNIETETLGEILREYIGLSDVLVHFILPDELSKYLQDKIDEKVLKVKIKSIKKIFSTEFKFDFESYTEKHEREIKEILNKLPQDTNFSEDTHIEKNTYDDSKGIEVYTPAHNHEYIGKGKITGPFRQIFELFKKCENHPLINVSKLHLNFK